MRTKTNYAEHPAELEVFSGDEGQSVVVLRLNIEEVSTEGEGEESTSYTADEYRLTVRNRVGLEEHIREHIDDWLNKAVRDDYNKAADEVRATRNELLTQCDWTQTVDAPLTDEKKQEWATYRVVLRDIPEQAGFPYDVTFPTKPE